MESDPWGTLDLDDSDLPSLLRHCKQRRYTCPAAAVNSLSPSISSQPPLESHPGQLQQPLPPSSSRRVTVPGPAGALRAAMLDRENRKFSSHQTGNDSMLSTQDFIRKTMDDTAEFDDEFSRHPWLSALQFIGAEDGLIPSTPIRSIKKCLKGDKIVQVVAVVKSCTPNGHGGLLLTLKDPTGTIGASIHHKILSQSEFGKDIAAGAVLILQENVPQVAMFVPVKSAHYLNVTLRNLVKVFCQSKGYTSQLYKSAYPVQYADPAKIVKKKMSSMQNVMPEDIEMRQSTRSDNSKYENVIKGGLFAGNKDSANVTSAKRGYISISQHPCNEEPKDSVNVTKGGTKGGSKESDNINTPLAETTGEQVQIQRQPLMSKATLPEWTDEQLDALFGDEHECSLFC